jgi:ectoine hydroxylase-related dioxygenase (phytanoyl-CoA dioxygenase family)
MNIDKIDLEQLKNKGYIIIKNFYTLNEIIEMRKIILYNMKIKKNMLILGNNSGSKPNFLNDKNYIFLTKILKLNDIHKIMNSIFNAPFHLCFHNDIGLNRIVNWHKDTLNNQYKHYQKTDIWSEHNGEKHEIYKFLIYLEDHSFDNNGLCLIEESHLDRNINIDLNKQKYIHNQIGDVIIFDQRITHRGQQNNNGSIDRILISLGFGKNNIFTKEFEEGTIKRQNDQNRMIKTN